MPMFLLHTVEQISRKLHTPSVLGCGSPINWLLLAIFSMQMLLSLTLLSPLLRSPTYLHLVVNEILVVSIAITTSPSLAHLGHTKLCTPRRFLKPNHHLWHHLLHSVHNTEFAPTPLPQHPHGYLPDWILSLALFPVTIGFVFSVYIF